MIRHAMRHTSEHAVSRPRLVPVSNKRIALQTTVYYNPATGKELGKEPNTDLSDMADMMREARAAQKEWASYSFRQRKSVILAIRDHVVGDADRLARIVSENSGKTRIDALATEVLPAALSADWYAKNAGKVLRPEKLARSSILFINKRNVIERYPLGVVGVISPWNYPLSIPFGEVIMGLMAGNAIMLKVSGAVTGVGLAIREVMEKSWLPRGLFQLVVGSGDEVLDAWLKHGIDKIFFTGSTETGTEVAYKAAKRLVPVSLELGGKDAMIVLPDADLERAANGAAWAGYQNAGQSCGGVERLYVHESVYDRFMDLLAGKTRALRVGQDTDFSVDVGAMINKGQWDVVNGQVEDALKKGARIVAQSEDVRPGSGRFYPPVLMEGVDHSMELMRRETFGPVIPAMKFKTIDEAVALANDSDMGLTASVWTRNLQEGREIARRIEAGVVTINDHLYSHGQPETPWGGWKKSGIGFTHSRLGLLEMTRAKLINWDTVPSRRNIWWFPYSGETYARLMSALKFAFPGSLRGLVGNGLPVIWFMLRTMFTRWKPQARGSGTADDWSYDETRKLMTREGGGRPH